MCSRLYIYNISVIFLSFLFLSGCGSPGTQLKPGFSFTTEAKYLPQGGVSEFGGPASRLTGQYHGLVSCDSEFGEFQLDLKASDSGELSGQITRKTIVKGRTRGQGRQQQESIAVVKGRYTPATSFFFLTMRNVKRGGIAGVHSQFIKLEGHVAPDASSLVAYDRSPFGMKCSSWVAQRGMALPDDWRFVEKMAASNGKLGVLDRFQLQRELKKDRERQSCDPEIASWLNSAAQFPSSAKPFEYLHYERLLYTDAIFMKHFGKSFFALEPLERKKIETRLRGSCQRDFAQRTRTGQKGHRNWQSGIATFADNSLVPDTEKAVAAIAFALESHWQALTRMHLDYMVKHQADPDVARFFVNPRRLLLATMLPEQKKAFLDFSSVRLKKIIVTDLKKNLEQALNNLPGTLETLNSLAEFSPRTLKRNPEIEASDIAALVRRADESIRQASVAATQNYAAGLSGIDGIRAIDNWRIEYSSLAKKLSEGNIQKMDGILAQRRVKLGEEVLAKEKKRFKMQVVDSGVNLKALLSSTKYETGFNEKYGFLASEAGYPAFAAQRRSLREGLFADTQTQMLSMIHSWKHARVLDEQASMYFLPGDQTSASGKKLYAALEKQRQKVAPFGEGNFNAYLNALYSYDSRFLRRADLVSILPVAQAMYNSMQPLIGGLEKLFFGKGGMRGTGRTQMDIEMAKLKESSLSYPLLAYYLINYQHYNKNCIKDPVWREVDYIWIRTLNDIVVESETYSKKFLIDRRFNHIFDEVFEKNPDKVTRKVLDRFFSSKGKIYHDELVEGTRRLMQKNCMDPVIRKLEDNMIKYFADVKKRLDAVR